MRGKHQRKLPVKRILRLALAFVLVFAVSVTTFATVMANTVNVTVLDGEKTYQFSMDSMVVEEVIAKAETYGLPPLAALDVCEWVENTTTLNVKRGVQFDLISCEGTLTLIGFEGETISKALQDHNIFLKEKDVVTPAGDTALSPELQTVTVARHNTVTVLADQKSQTVSMMDGTVQEALSAAQVSLGEADTVNFPLDARLSNNMIIRVSRRITVTVLVGEERQEHQVSAYTVADALKKAGVDVGEHDLVTPPLTTKVEGDLEVRIRRVEIKEVTEEEEIPFETTYEDDDTSYVDETQTITEGKAGLRETVYQLYYIDGEEDRKEVKETRVTQEPVGEVIARGTKDYPVETPASGGSSSGGSTEFSYAYMLTGTGTAYCDTGITASGVQAGWGYVAVNPNVIPYGTRLYIRSADGAYDYGYCVAADTGGNLLNGNVLVDLWYPDYGSCAAFGSRSIEVYVLD